MSHRAHILTANRQGFISMAVAAFVGVAGLGALGYGLHVRAQQPDFVPITSQPAAAAVQAPVEDPHAQAIRPLGFSEPTRIVIPSIGVDSPIIQVGKNPDGTLEVPSGEDFNKAAWYVHSPTPGQPGASIVEGHVDQANGKPSVFYRLGELEAQAEIAIHRADGTMATFRVHRKEKFAKDTFPTDVVYSSGSAPKLHLITCGGTFDRHKGEYDSNVVVFAELAGVQQADTGAPAQ